MTHKFSVIIPSHNEGEWLKKTVLGVLEKTEYPDFEIVVVADGCTDNSTDFLKNGNFPQVKLVELDKSIGSVKSRNAGAEKAEGEFFVFIDSHMIPCDGKWLSELKKQLKNQKIGAASLRIPHLEKPNSVAYVYTIGGLALEPTWVQPRSKEKPQIVPVIPGGCFGIRRDVFESVGGFDNGLRKWGREDLELSLRLWRLGYDLSMSPCSGIFHSWKRKRTFKILWKEVDYNIIRIALTLFSKKWSNKVIKYLKKQRQKNAEESLKMLKEDDSFKKRKRELNKRFVRSFEQYCEEFKDILPILKYKSSALSKDLNVQIEAVNFCNRKCRFCFLGHFEPPKPKVMPLSAFEKILRELRTLDRNINLVSFSSYCEPTLDPHLIERMELLKKYNFSYWNITNGTNLNKKIIDYFLKNLNLIRNSFLINLPAVNEKEYTRLTGGTKEQLEKTKKNLRYLGSKIKKHKIKAIITVLGWGNNAHEKNFGDVKEELKNYGFAFSKSGLSDRAGQLRPHVDNKFYLENPESCDCGGNRFEDYLHFGVEGNLYVCCQDFEQKYSFGNIKEKSLKKILNSKKRKDMINAMKNNLCKRCVYAK